MICDKCGKETSEDNSVIQFLYLEFDPCVGAKNDRHLYPELGCPGSPSRVKIIEDSGMTKEQYFQAKKQTIKEWCELKRRYPFL